LRQEKLTIKAFRIKKFNR